MDVEVSHLTKRFTLKGSPAVFDASFVAPSGKVTALLGPSGSGKTTVLRCIAGLEPVSEGRILLGSDDVTQIPVDKRGIGFVFQAFALFDLMTVRKNVAFGLEIRGTAAADVRARVDELLGLVQIGELSERFPDQLSGSQKQRVGFARALAPRPKVLLLDEPFGQLDSRVRVELRDFLRGLHQATHLTTILVTHDQDEAMEMADQIVVMHQGRVHQTGTPREIYDAPRTPFVAGFVGGANVLAGRVSRGRATLGSLSVAAPADMPEGTAIRAIVRPHDVKIARAVPGSSVALATITRLFTVGPTAKLQLTLPSGDVIAVELPRTQLDAMAIVQGDLVKVDLEEAKIFRDDYAI